MNAFGRKWFGLAAWGALVVLCGPEQAVAAVALQPGTTIEFATVSQGREVLTNRDEFIQLMSQFDRYLRMNVGTHDTLRIKP